MEVQEAKQFSSEKIFKHLDRVAVWQAGGCPWPITAEIFLTDKCTHRCPNCFYREQRGKNVMDTEFAKSVIDQLVECGLRGLTFSGGGEPLCHPDAIDLIEYAGSKIDTALITNGSLIHDRIECYRLLSSCQWIRVSLDAGSPEMFKKTHGLGEKEFEHVLNNIKALVDVRNRANLKCTIGVGYLTSRETLDGMIDFAKLASELGVDYAQFRPLLRTFSEKEDPDFCAKEVYAIIDMCKKYEHKGFEILYSKHKYDAALTGTLRDYDRCEGANFATTVGADGGVYLCCHTAGLEEFKIGDLHKSTFYEIWTSGKRREIIERLDVSKCPSLCRCNAINSTLARISKVAVHKNFL